MNPYFVCVSCSRMASRILRGACWLGVLLSAAVSTTQQSSPPLELSRTVRTWEFLPVVGTRAGLFGDETGRFEAAGTDRQRAEPLLR